MNTRSFYLPLFLVALAHFSVDVMIGIWPIYKTIAELDLAIAGLISGFGAFFGEGMQAWFGNLSDAGHRKKLILGGVLAATASAFLAFTTDYGILFVLFLITCIGSGAFHPSAASFAAAIDPKRKAMMVAIFSSAGFFGLAFSQLIFTTAFFAFEGNLLWLTIPMILLVFVMGAFHFQNSPNNDDRSVGVDRPKRSLKGYIEFLKEPHLRNLYILQVCNQSVFWGLIFLLPDILKEREYDSWLSLGGGHMCLVLGGACMLIPGGILADRYSCRSVLLTATGVAIVAFYTLLLNPFLSPVWLCPLLFVMGGALGTVNPVGVAFANHLKPDNPGAVSALMMGLVWCVAEGIGQTGGGILTKFFTEEASAKSLAIVGAFLVIGFFTARVLPGRVSQTVQIKVS